MIRINLLPQDARKTRRASAFKIDRTRVVPVAALVVAGLACTCTTMLQGARLTTLEKDVAESRAECEQYKRTIALIDEMVIKETELNRRLALVEQLDHNRFKTVRVLDEVARRVPRYMWLTAMKNLSADRVSFDGYAFSNLVVSDLMSSLDKSELFHDTELTVVKRQVVDGQNTVSFTVTSTVKAGPLPASPDRPSES
ncbi:MAG: PilN domain-containing protein [bacterium]